MTQAQSRSGRPAPAIIFGAVVASLIAGIIFFTITVYIADSQYRIEHNLAPVETGFWIFKSHRPAYVSWADLGAGTVWGLALLAGFYTIVVHPILGRLTVALTQILTARVDEVYGMHGQLHDWDPDNSLALGSVWPITLLGSALLLIAWILGSVYRALWS